MDTGEKIITIFVSEVIEALLFIVIILLFSSLPEYPGKSELVTAMVSAWGLLGIGTPFIIWFELWDSLRGGLRY